MIPIPWYVAALGAAVMWGLHYPLISYALKHVTLPTVLALSLLPLFFLAPLFYRPVMHDIHVIAGLDWASRAMILALSLTGLTGTIFLILAIGGKNATLAALIEISYPVFVALFAWLLFREVHVTTHVLLGAALVFSGLAVIILGSR
jgi:drug/metabolite transporter (DMT)-like permease